MNLMGMSYKDFFWTDNPTSLTVSEGRSVKETLLPFAGTKITDLGFQKRKVTGEGYFTGEDCWQRWNALREIYRRGGPGSLRLPGQEPFLALFDSLKLMGVSGKELVKYSFSFTETKSGASGVSGAYTAAEGESLWDYAYRYDRTVEELTKANPDIRDVAYLSAGQEVRVP